MTEKTTGKRGFAAMTPEQRQKVARLGGLSVPKLKRSFSQDRQLASNAGRKGGKQSAGRDRSVRTGQD